MARNCFSRVLILGWFGFDELQFRSIHAAPSARTGTSTKAVVGLHVVKTDKSCIKSPRVTMLDTFCNIY